MFQKVIVILKNGSKKEVLKLSESNGRIKVALSENIKYPSTLLIDCGMEFELNLTCGITEFSGSISDDVSAVLLTDGEVYSGVNGKKDRCYHLLSAYDDKYKKEKISDELPIDDKKGSGTKDKKADAEEKNAADGEEKNDVDFSDDTDKFIEEAEVKEKKERTELNGQSAKTSVQSEGAPDIEDSRQSEIGLMSKNADKKAECPHGDDIAKKATETNENSEQQPSVRKEPTIFFGGIEFVGNNFYQAVKSQLDEMFICYPVESRLTERLPNSKWIRVDCEDEYYVVGLIYELDEVIYVCYGIPGNDKVLPPDEIKDVAQYVDIDDDGGVWMIFQDAKTGKCISREDVVKI
ncbi:MAG: hypothetical protein ACI4MT_02385 [Christensenellales bacterium]